MPDTIDHFARIAKEATFGRKVVGAFYGFMYEFRGDPEYGHNALAKFNSSPWLDFIYVTASYGNRHFGRGGDYPRSPAHSVRLHNKLWYHDNDVVSFMADKMWAGRPQNDGSLNDVTTWKENLGYTSTAQQSIWMYRRSFGFALCSGAYESFFDLHGGYYDHPELMAEVQRIHQAADYAKRYDRSSNSEILVVADEASCAYATFRSELLEASLLTPQLQLVQLGAPADHVLLSDLDRLNTAQYKFVIFLNCYRFTSSDRALITRKLKHSGKHLLWCYAPGYFDEGGRSREAMAELTGMRLMEGDDPEFIAPQVSLDSSWLGKPETDRSDALLGTPRKICHLIHVADPDAVTRGRLPGTHFVTFAKKSMPDWVSLYTITPNLTSAVYRELAREAGVHIFNERDDSFYANQNFVAVHANGAGPRTITFPRACSAVNVMTRELVMADRTSFDHNFQNGETLILKWQSRP